MGIDSSIISGTAEWVTYFIKAQSDCSIENSHNKSLLWRLFESPQENENEVRNNALISALEFSYFLDWKEMNWKQWTFWWI